MAKTLTPEEQQRLSAIRSANMKKAHTPEAIEKGRATRKRNKEMRLEARYILNAELMDENEIAQELEAIGYGRDSENGPPTFQTAMLYGIMKKAVHQQDVEAARFIRDTSGQKPVDGMQIGLLDDKPLDIDLRTYSNEQLREMIAKRIETE